MFIHVVAWHSMYAVAAQETRRCRQPPWRCAHRRSAPMVGRLERHEYTSSLWKNILTRRVKNLNLYY
jgi:hypothetical protein